MSKVIAIVGMPGSGKGTLTDHLSSLGYKLIHFGQMIVDEVESRGLEVNEQNERLVREDMRAKHGKDIFAKRVAEKAMQIVENGEKVVAIDGLYSWTEFKVLEKEFGEDLVLIATFTPKSVRYERLATRQYRPLTKTEVESRDKAEIENLEKGGPIAFADYTIVNDQDVNYLTRRLDQILKDKL